MTDLSHLGRVETADIVVVGGGIGGLVAAVAAKEKNPDADVLVVERATSGWAGQANKGAGIWWYLAPEDDADAFVKFHCDHIGHYIEDQELLAEFGRESQGILERVDGWTHKLQRRDGEIIHKRFKPFLPWSLTGMDLDLMRVLARHAKKLGVRFIDKTSLTDLLTDGGRVAGAVGFSLLDGSPIIIQAPAAIIATGGQSYRIMGMWSCQRGDGLGMAWRAGAEMRNAEWGPFAQLAGIRGKEPLIGAEDALYNAWHQKLSPRFRGEREADVCGMTSATWYKEMVAGNGPLVTFHPENWMLANTTEDVEGGTVWDRPLAVKFWTTLISRIRAADAPGAFLEVYPAVLGELSPIKVDHQMATTVPGLYACGNACYNGSGLPGAVPASPGRMRGSGALRRHLHGHPRRRVGGKAGVWRRVAQARRGAGRGARPRGPRSARARGRRAGHGPRQGRAVRREPGRLLDLQERGAHDRGAPARPGRQGAPAAGQGGRPALPGGRPRRPQHGAERRAVLPHGTRAQGVARLVHPRGLP